MLTVSRSNSRFARTLASSALATWTVGQSLDAHGDKNRLTSQREQFGPENRVKRGIRLSLPAIEAERDKFTWEMKDKEKHSPAFKLVVERKTNK